MFINDVDYGITDWLLKFADDVKLFGKDLDHITLQQELQRLFDWDKEWQMEFNVDKCKVIHIGNSKNKLQALYGQEIVEESARREGSGGADY